MTDRQGRRRRQKGHKARSKAGPWGHATTMLEAHQRGSAPFDDPTWGPWRRWSVAKWRTGHVEHCRTTWLYELVTLMRCENQLLAGLLFNGQKVR